MRIPTAPQNITPVWLTDALGSTGAIKQAEVQSFQIEPMDDGPGYSGSLARLTLGYSASDDSGPRTLIAKFSSADPNIRQALAGLYTREVRFYRELATQAQVPTPRCFYADIDPNTGESILLLEDLSRFRRIETAEGCGLAEADMIIHHLARFHAHWWNNSQLQTIADWVPLDPHAPTMQERFQSLWPDFAPKINRLLPDFHLPPSLLDFGRAAGQKMDSLNTRLSQAPTTFIHKDTHLGNLMFGINRDDPPLMFLDWQLAGIGRGVSDVTYFMISSLPIVLRRQSERSLLETYHRALVQHGVQGYDFEDCWADYQWSAFRILWILVYVVSALNVDRPDGRRFIEAALTRLTAFAEDHDLSKFL